MNATTSAATVTDLVAAARDGDRLAFEQLVRRFDRHVWAVARSFRLRESDRHDAVQSTWLRLVEKLDDVRDPERLGGWLGTTTARECLRVLRGAERESVADDDVLDQRPDERFPLPEQKALDDLMSAALWEQVDALPAAGRTLLRALTGADAMPYAELSRRTGMPVGSIGPTRGRYLLRLRGVMERAGLGYEAWV